MSLPVIAMAVMGIGTAVSAYGQYRQGQAAKAAGDLAEEVSIANAEAARTKAAYEEAIQRDKLKKLMGRTRTLYAKAGVDISEGSPLLMLMEQAEEGERDAQAIRYGGEVNAASSLNQGIMAGYQGEQAYNAGMISAGSTFLTGLGQTGIAGYQYKKKIGPFKE
jgi:hypothetical protein